MSKADPTRPQIIKSALLHNPSEQILTNALTTILLKNYKHVTVEFVSKTPDLTQKPWNLASPGICGNSRLCDVGGVPFLVPGPAAWKERVYDIRHVAKQCDLENAFVLGASACSRHFLGSNAELMPNSASGKNNTHCAKMMNDEDYTCERYESTEFTLLGNLYLSDGHREGRALHIKVKHRIGNFKSLITCIQSGLADHFPSEVIGLGGCFLSLGKTSTKVHVMPDFSKTPLNTDDEVENWLRFYETEAPLSHLSFMTSRDVGDLDIRIEHTHSFSGHGHGGHYHGDVNVNLEEVEYEGYFGVAEKIYRVDQPEMTHQIGRD